MLRTLKDRFKESPSLYYSMSICATWAGIGSLMNGVQLTQTLGIVPSLIWVLGNTLACIVYGIIAPKIPKVRDVFRSKLMLYVMGIMCVFQAWLSMNGMQNVFADTVIGGTGGIIVAYTLAILFVVLLLKYGMIRNVLTDNYGWLAVYALAVIVTVCAMVSSKGNYNHIEAGMNMANMKEGIWKAILLLPGPFTYPYFFEILDYNDSNTDGTKRINTTKVFTMGGLMFGLYMAIVFALAWANFSPILNMMKAILITIIGTSTLSSSIYSIYIAFGKKLGLAINAGLVLLWQIVVPLGVMGLWTLMASIRMPIVIACIAFAIGWNYKEQKDAGKCR